MDKPSVRKLSAYFSFGVLIALCEPLILLAMGDDIAGACQDVCGQGDAGFMAIGQPPGFLGLDRLSGEDGESVASALEIHERAECSVHAQPFGQPRGLIDAAASPRPIVHFLQGDDVGIERLEGGRRSFEIDGAIHASAVLDVVGRDSHRSGMWGFVAGFHERTSCQQCRDQNGCQDESHCGPVYPIRFDVFIRDGLRITQEGMPSRFIS